MMPSTRNPYRMLRIVPPVFLLFTAIYSLFLPYVLRTHIRDGNPGLSHFVNGYSLIAPYGALLFFAACCLLIVFGKGKATAILAFSAATLACASMQPIRVNIHYQFWFHEFDTRSGIGFYVICACSAALLVVALIHFIVAFVRPEKPEQQNADLLDDLP